MARATHCIDLASLLRAPQADVVGGRSPWQGFPNLGSKDPDDPLSKLWKEYVGVALKANAELFVLANVERFSKSLEFPLLMGSPTSGKLGE